MQYLIAAIVCDPKGNHPLFGDQYYKIAWNSDNPNVDQHMSDLTNAGYRVLSVKSHPAVFQEDKININSDNQGNQTIVDGKVVNTKDYPNGG
jgi:hypothetical protein